MGWMGWTEEQTLRTTIPAIETAYNGRCKMLSAIFGGGKPDAPVADSIRPANLALFDAMFGGDA